jgi:hypothetical protein
LAKYSDLAFSIHLNYVKHFGVDKFLNSVKAATETTEIGHQEDTDAKYNWNIVRIMLDPGNLELAKETYNRFKEQFKDCKNFVLAVDLVHDIMGGKTLYKYSDEELSWLETTH